MRVIKAEFTLSIGYATAIKEDTMEFEFEDDKTQGEINSAIEEAWQEWKQDYIEGGWKILTNRAVK